MESNFFEAKDAWVVNFRVPVYPIGWFSRLVWRFIRCRAHSPNKIYLRVWGAGGSGGSASDYKLEGVTWSEL